MKKTILIIAALLLSGSAFATQPFVPSDPLDQCEIENGCLVVGRLVMNEGLNTTAGAGLHLSADETGAVNLDMVGIANRLDLRGTTLFQKSQFDLTCNANGLLDLNFGGDYYVAPNACVVKGITNERPGTPVDDAHPLRILFKDKVDLLNMRPLPAFYGKLHLKDGADFHSGPVLIQFLMDSGEWHEVSRTPY